MIEDDCPERCPWCSRKNSNPRLDHWFSKCYLFGEFRKKYFNDIEFLYEKIFIISKYSPISNSNVITVIKDINNVESSTDFENSNEVFNINLIILILVIVKIGILILMIVKIIVSLLIM